MHHRRIRAGNSKTSYHAPGVYFDSSKAVVAGDQVFVVGCTGLELDGSGFVGQGDPAAQAEAAMASLRTLVEEAGARLEDVCLINTFTTRHEYRALIYPVIGRHLQGVNPVSTGVVVADLAAPYLDFEIDAWVVIPRDREEGHERFRLTNARGGFLMPHIDYGNARVIKANDHLFLQGQTGMSLDGRRFDGASDPARQAEVAMSTGSTVVEAVRQIEVTEQTFYRWRNEYGGLSIDQAKRLKQIEAENSRLKRAIADLTLDNQILKEAAEGNF